MERTAIAYCRLSAEEFDAMTPQEVQWRIQAETDRENREFEHLAQLACWVINPWLGMNAKPLHVWDLLRRRVTLPED